jgi:actin-related protein 4
MLTDFRYSQSKATALVVDIGALNTSVTALWDGMVLQKSESRLQFISTP